MEVICLEDAAFYALVKQVVAILKYKNGAEKDKWIADEEAIQLLNIKLGLRPEEGRI